MLAAPVECFKNFSRRRNFNGGIALQQFVAACNEMSIKDLLFRFFPRRGLDTFSEVIDQPLVQAKDTASMKEILAHEFFDILQFLVVAEPQPFGNFALDGKIERIVDGLCEVVSLVPSAQ